MKEHNTKFERGEETYDVELNKFADMDNLEFKAMYTGLKRKAQATTACTGQI